jgi:hypothetical protein
MWKEIDRDTDRLKVLNGWIVRSMVSSSVHQIFVEDVDHNCVLCKKQD